MFVSLNKCVDRIACLRFHGFTLFSLISTIGIIAQHFFQKQFPFPYFKKDYLKFKKTLSYDGCFGEFDGNFYYRSMRKKNEFLIKCYDLDNLLTRPCRIL